jgi:uncharacterized OsmC-like protein
MAKSTFKATTRLLNGVQAEAEARGFKIVIDEPLEKGGTNQSMTPMELFLCSLGSCQTIVAAMYAEFKDIDLQDFWVEIEGDHDREYTPGYTEIRVKTHIKTDSPPEDVKRFIEFLETTGLVIEK